MASKGVGMALNGRMVNAFVFLCLGFALAFFIVGYVSAEHPAYIWDWGGYFDMYRRLGEQAASDPYAAIRYVVKSVNADDYNVSSVSLLMPVYFLMGSERLPYILGISFLFLIPAVCLALYLSLVAYKKSVSGYALFLAFLFVLLFPPFWQAALRGMPDIVGLIPLSIASVLLVRSEYLTKNSLKNAVLVGALIWLTFMFRRWYAYAGLSLMVCAFVMAVGGTWLKRKPLSDLVSTVFAFVVAGGVGAVLLYAFQYDLAYRVLVTSYGDLYKAYQEPFLNQLWRYYAYAGPVSTVLFFIGIFISIKNHYHDVLFFTATGTLTIVLFASTQSPSMQHVLPVYLFFAPAAVVSLFSFFKLSSFLLKAPGFLVLSVIFAGNYLTSFSPAFNNAVPYFHVSAPLQTHHPLYLDNYDEYRRLIADLQQRLTKADQFAVFASSELLADSLLRALDRTLEPDIAWSSHVDERDGFGVPALRARFAVVATPIPIHLPESSQKVITVPAEMILSGQGIGADYKQVSGPYELANGHMAYIYERLVPLSEGSIRMLEAHLKAFHNHWQWDGADRIGVP